MKYYVYITTNLITGKQYVGEHKYNEKYVDTYLGSGLYFTRSLKKYGKENFKKEILEYFDSKPIAFQAQKKYIEKYNTVKPNGYNLSPTGGIGDGHEMSEETKRKIGQSHLGKKRTVEQCKNIREGRIKNGGYAVSDETLNKMRGLKRSDEAKLKMSKSHKGKKLTEEHRKNISISSTGKKVELGTRKKMSDKARKNISKSQIGRKPWNTGKKLTEEHKKKLSEAKKKNPPNSMKGRSLYSVWLEKYGKDEADKRKKLLYEKIKKTKMSKNQTIRENDFFVSEVPLCSLDFPDILLSDDMNYQSQGDKKRKEF